ncbi:MAG: hypothetical protein P8125_03130 [Gemmatimonadota bacterium]
MRIILRSRSIATSCVLAIGILAACQSYGDGSPFLTEPVGADAMAGAWLLHLPATNNCNPALPAIDLRLVLERFWVAGIDNEGDREYLLGRWGTADEESEDQVLQGWIEPQLRRLHLILWQGVHERGSVLRADVFGGEVMEGRLVEPVPPYPGGGFAEPSEGYPGGFTESSCLWTVRGSRIEE